MAVAGEDRDPVAVLMLCLAAAPLLSKSLRAHDLEDGAEDFLLNRTSSAEEDDAVSIRVGPTKKPFSWPCSVCARRDAAASLKPRPSTAISAPSASAVSIHCSTPRLVFGGDNGAVIRVGIVWRPRCGSLRWT